MTQRHRTPCTPARTVCNQRHALTGLLAFSPAFLPAFLPDFLLLPLVAFALACMNPAQAAESRGVQGVVSKVTDGDSLWLTPAGKPPIKVRLRDIDAPESCQPWGEQARAALTDLALNKVATLQISGRDSYGRTLGVLMIDELNVGKTLVENGHAWSTRSRWDQGPLVKQEKMARALSRGLHGAAGAMQPAEFRRRHGKCEFAEPPSKPAEAASMVKR